MDLRKRPRTDNATTTTTAATTTTTTTAAAAATTTTTNHNDITNNHNEHTNAPSHATLPRSSCAAWAAPMRSSGPPTEQPGKRRGGVRIRVI